MKKKSIFTILIFALAIHCAHAQTDDEDWYMENNNVPTPTLGNGGVYFDSNFESGSIGSAVLTDSTSNDQGGGYSVPHLYYTVSSRSDPQNPVDPSVAPSSRWFYFRMAGTRGKFIDLTLENTDPLRAVYSYDGQHFVRFAENEASKGRIYKYFDADTVYVAYFVPYTNAYLNRRIDSWLRHRDVKVQDIGDSENGLAMPMLTITSRYNAKNDRQKRRIWIHARTHTSETPSSWHLDGLIDALLHTPEGDACRENCIFYITPFANPDGVAEGLSRSNTMGVNEEINWNQDDGRTTQEVRVLKNAIDQLTASRPFDLALNLHAQVANNATYMVHNTSTTNEDFYRREMLLAHLNMQGSPAQLTPDELSVSKLKAHYPEGWFWQKSGDKTLAMTIEMPYTYFGASQMWADTASLRHFGAETLNAISLYFGLDTDKRIILDNDAAKARGFETEKSANVLYMGKDYLQAKRAGKKITYKYKNLPAGTYNIYRWNAADMDEDDLNGNHLVRIGTFTQKKAKTLKYKLKSASEGEIFDALVLERQ